MLEYIRSQIQVFVLSFLALGSTYAWAFWNVSPEVNPEFLVRSQSYMEFTIITSISFGLCGAIFMMFLTRSIVYSSEITGIEHIVIHSEAKRNYSVAIGVGAPLGGFIITNLVKYRIYSWSWAWFWGGTLFFAGLLLLSYSKVIKDIKSAKET